MNHRYAELLADGQDGHLYLGEMDRYADGLDEAATNDDAAR